MLSPNPRISRLTPLDVALRTLETLVRPVPPVQRLARSAVGAVVAEDVRAPSSLPGGLVAYADGWAVNAEDVVGASAYGAAVLAPPPAWVNAGEPVPRGADAVLPPDAVTIDATGAAEAVSSAAPGEGVRGTGQNVQAGALLVAAGTRLTHRHAAILMASGADMLSVRKPRVALVVASSTATPYAESARLLLEALGGDVAEQMPVAGDQAALSAAFQAANVDLLVSIGGTGEGSHDCAVAALADTAQLHVHGIAIRPGEQAAIGLASDLPVLLLPARLDALIAGLLVVAEPLLRRLSGAVDDKLGHPVNLAGKASSVIGFTELFLGVPHPDGVQPVPLSEAGFPAIAQAAGWFSIPPGSEGLAPGETVHLRPFGATERA